MKFFKLSIATFLLTLTAQAEILIFQSSDNHSAYDKIPNYIKSTSALARQFKLEYPTSDKIFHFFNGDLAGPSPWTDFDNGKLNYALVAKLGQIYDIALNMGNHEAFDYRAEKGNRLFIDQARYVKKKLGKSYNTINVIPGAAGRNIFTGVEDFVTPNQTKVRIAGLVLADFYRFSTYGLQAPSQPVAQVLELLPVLKSSLLQAQQDGIAAMIFQIHESHAIVNKVFYELFDWITTQPQLKNLRIPLVIVGHDHEMHITRIENTVFVDSGDNYSFSQIILTDDGEVKSVEHFNHEKQKSFEHQPVSFVSEQEALKLAQRIVKKINQLNSHNINDAPILAFNETRNDLKARRTLLGNKLANSLRNFANAELQEHAGYKNVVTDTLALFNSGTYRHTKPLEAKPITVGQIKAIYPFPGPVQVLLMTGEQVQEMFQSLRDYGISQKQYTPQLSSNLREEANFLLSIKTNEGWKPIDRKATYAVGLDPWLAINGFKVQHPSWDFSQNEILATAENSEVWKKYFVSELYENSPCESLITNQK